MFSQIFQKVVKYSMFSVRITTFSSLNSLFQNKFKWKNVISFQKRQLAHNSVCYFVSCSVICYTSGIFLGDLSSIHANLKWENFRSDWLPILYKYSRNNQSKYLDFFLFWRGYLFRFIFQYTNLDALWIVILKSMSLFLWLNRELL